MHVSTKAYWQGIGRRLVVVVVVGNLLELRSTQHRFRAMSADGWVCRGCSWVYACSGVKQTRKPAPPTYF
jgi:hypothetical protein